MIKQITKQLNALGIQIRYAPLDNNGFFGIYQHTPIIMINEQLDTISTAITLLHEFCHFLNEDDKKVISNYRQNSQIEYKANRFMIYHILRLLDEEYNFTPATSYTQIRNALSLPSCLDHLLFNELYQLIKEKFDIDDETNGSFYTQEQAMYITTKQDHTPVPKHQVKCLVR